MMELKNVSSGYGKREILHGVNLTVQKGEILTLIGSNGCGKSTLLKTMLGFLPLLDGEILMDGASIRELSSAEIARRAAYLPQTRNVADISVGRLVLHGRFPYLQYPRKYRKEDFAIAGDAMKRMGIEEWEDTPLSELSGGMRQKAYLAMALAQEAPIIVMDEPTTYLDIGQQMKFIDLVKDLAKSGKTILLVLHDMLLAWMLSDRIAVVADGTIRETGTPEELLERQVLEKLYGVSIRKVETEHGAHYYYEAAEGKT